MTTKLALYNGALRKIGQPTLTAVTDEGTGRRALDAAYDEVVAYCLERGMWNFAMRFVKLTASSSASTSFGYSYVFDKPDDWVRTAGVTVDDRGNTPLLNYDDMTDYWTADLQTIFVRYVSNDASFGMDLGRWPESFVQYVQTALAVEICDGVTGSDTKKADLTKELRQAFGNASNKDEMNEAVTKFPPTGSILRARGGSASNRNGRY